MPYLPVDLDAKRKAEFVDKACGLSKGATISGLLDAWEHVWRTKSDVLGELYVTACFGPDKAVRAALVEAGFVEPVDGGQWRMKGAAKWLFGMEGKARGGHAAKSNLVPGAVHRKPKSAEEPKPVSSAPAQAQPNPPLGSPSADASALNPSIQQPESIFKSIAGEPPAPPKPTRLKALTERLVATYAELGFGKYKYGGAKDTDGLKGLLPVATDDEIDAIWRLGLLGSGWLRVSTFAQLSAKWNDLRTSVEPARKVAALNPTRPTGAVANEF